MAGIPLLADLRSIREVSPVPWPPGLHCWRDHDHVVARGLLGFLTVIAREMTAKSSCGILNRPTRNVYPQRRLSLMKLSWSISGLIGASMRVERGRADA